MNNNILDTYGESFQFFIIKAILNNPQFFKAIREHLKVEFFTNEYIQIIYKLICDFYNTNKKVPEYDTLEYLIKGKYHDNILVRSVCLKCIFNLLNLRAFRDEEVIKQKTLDLCKRQAAIKATEKSVDLIKTYSEDTDLEPDFTEIYKIWGEVLKISADQINSEMVSAFEETYQSEDIRKNVKSTGFRILDALYGRGVGAGDLITLAGFSGNFKTGSVINLGARAIQQGQSVLHFTFENPKIYLMRRYHSLLTNIPLKKLYEQQDLVRQKIEPYTGKLHVKENVMMKHNLTHLESYYSQLIDTGFVPDKIIVDSPLHLKSSSKREKYNEEVSEIWKEIKSFAQTIERPIYTTAQLNRQGDGERSAESSAIGSAIQIYQDSDIMIFIGRDGENDKFNNRLFYTNKKSRYGPDGQVWECILNPATCAIDEEEVSCNKIITQLIQGEISNG